MAQSLLSSIFLSPNPTSLLSNLTTFQKPYPRPISSVHVALPPTTKKPPPRLLTTSAVNKTTTSAVAISRGKNKLTTEKRCNAKFACTIGPATCTEGEMEALARDQGTSVVSIKMCHGEKDWYRTVIGHMRSERRMGDFGGATSSAKEGDVWTFSIRAFHTTLPKHMVDVNYDGFDFDVRVGDEVLVDSGMTRFEVIEKIGFDVISRCIDPGLILSRQSSTNKQFDSRKNTHRIPKGVIHIQESFKNTIVTVTDLKGQVLSWSSCGTCDKLTPTSFLSSQERFGGENKKFKGAEKATPFVAQMAAKKAIHKVVDQGMHRAEVRIKGPGPGRDAALRAIVQSGIKITFIRDLTPMPHNGCRPPKKRRLSRN